GYEGRALALLTVEDVTDAFCTRAALDKAEEAVLIVDSKTRVITFNKHSRALFPDADVGTEAARLLSHPGQSDLPWWDPGLRGRAPEGRGCELAVRLGQRRFHAQERGRPHPRHRRRNSARLRPRGRASVQLLGHGGRRDGRGDGPRLVARPKPPDRRRPHERQSGRARVLVFVEYPLLDERRVRALGQRQPRHGARLDPNGLLRPTL